MILYSCNTFFALYRFLADDELTELEKIGTIDMLMEFHTSTETLAIELYSRFRRKNYVAPISFLEAIYIFREKLKERKM